MRPDEKQRLSQLRRWRIRKKVAGTKDCPRMSVKFTNQHIYVQFINDAQGVTLASASTVGQPAGGESKRAANAATAKRVGALAAEAARNKGINKVVFDRGGARY